MPTNDKDVNKIASMLTDDPDIFVEAKGKGPSNPPDCLEVDDKFEVDCAPDEYENHEPQDSTNRKSSLLDGPNGAKQTGSPYLK